MSFIQGVMARCTDPGQQEKLRNTFHDLETPKPGSLMDLSAQIKLLGDLPMVAGALSDYWLGGTSSGKFVAVKLTRRTLDPEDEDVRCFCHAPSHDSLQACPVHLKRSTPSRPTHAPQCAEHLRDRAY